MAELVSVIVPIYNVEDYLERCVESILAQTYPDLEIILVDDGSADGSGAICDRYAATDARVRVIHKENGGVSSARNAGLDAAGGAYILFIDSDDQPDPDMTETMVRALEQNSADIVTVNFRAVSPTQTKEQVMQLRDEVLTFSKPDISAIGQIWGTKASIFVWNNLYRKDLIDRYALRFEDMQKVHSEDQLFNYCYYLAVRRAVCISRSLYSYTKREQTLSHSLKPTQLLDRRITLVHSLRTFAETCFPKQDELFYTVRMWTYFADGCGALRNAERILEGIGQISPENLVLFRRCLRRMLFGKAGRVYARSMGFDLRADLYFRLTLLLLLLGKYERPVKTYLASEG